MAKKPRIIKDKISDRVPQPSYLVMPYVYYIVKLSRLNNVDPAMIATLVEMYSMGQWTFREFVSFNWTYYFAGSSVWQHRLQEYKLRPEDITSTYGLWAIPYMIIYSSGIQFTLKDLYDHKKMFPFVCRYLINLLLIHKGNINWALTNYHYLGTINSRTVSNYQVDFLQKYIKIRERYLAWKIWMMGRGFWHETVLPAWVWVDYTLSTSNTESRRDRRSIPCECSRVLVSVEGTSCPILFEHVSIFETHETKS